MNIKYTLLGIVLLIIIGISIWIQVAIPEMRGAFYGDLVDKNPEYIYSFGVFLVSLFIYYIADSIRPLVMGIMGLKIREILTFKILKRPVCLEENADGRITEDARNFIDISFGLVIDFIIAFCAVVGLIFAVPEALTYYTWGYTIIVTCLAILFNRPLVKTQYDVQAVEQTMRIDVRGNILDNKNNCIKASYSTVWDATVRSLHILTWFRTFASAKMLVAITIPFLVLIPVYMSGAIDFNTMIQGVSTFDLLVANTTILVNSYPLITRALASYKRIKEI